MPGGYSDIDNSLLQLSTGKFYGFLYRNDRDHQRVLAPFISQGLQCGEIVIYITGAHHDEYVINLLKRYGCDPLPYLASGQLLLIPATEAYYADGSFQIDAAIDVLVNGVAQSLGEGYPSIRVTGDLTSILCTTPGAERLMKYEEQLRLRFPRQCLSLYQYDCRRCLPAILLHVIQAHPVLIIDTEVITDNVFYMPPTDNQHTLNASVKLRRQMDLLIQRNRANRRHRRGEERIRLGLEGSNAGLWDVNLDTGEIVNIEGWAGTTGHDHTEEILSLEAWKENLHPEDKSGVLDCLQAHLRGETPHFEIAHRLRENSGEWRSVLDHGRVVERDHGGRPRRFVGMYVDIAQHEQDGRSDRAIRQLKEAEQLRRQFLSFVSHELSAPLTPILGAIEMLKYQTIGPVNEQQLNALELAHRQLGRLHRLIHDLRDIFQLESGRLSLNVNALSIPGLIDEAVLAYKHLAWERGVYLRAHHQHPDLNAEVDAKRFEQILDNLIEQAIERTQQGGVTITSRLEQGQAVITITDSGEALTPDEAAQLFDDYNSRGLNSRKGLALGMSLVKLIVEAHMGTLEVQNQPTNSGASFIITLPIVQPVAVGN